MNKYQVLVPYQEKVYGTVCYEIPANSMEEAQALWKSADYYQWFCDTEQDGCIDYEEFTEEAEFHPPMVNQYEC